MRSFILGWLAIGVSSMSVHAADLNVGVVISGEVHPGVYGRVEIGSVPPPLVFPRPVVIVPEPHRHYEPLYLHVPPGHAKNWRKHCSHYNACGRPVYFVRSAEYDPGYRPERYRGDDDRGRGDHDHGKGKSKNH